jgi:hypothetical protein
LTHTSDAQDSCVDIHGIETQASQNVFIAWSYTHTNISFFEEIFKSTY